MTSPTSLQTSAAGRVVSSFAHSKKEVANLFDFSWEKDYTGVKHQLAFENPFHSISVTFHPLKGRSDAIRITSSNWRCEDEPNGIYNIKEARAFYRALVEAGFVAF